MNEGQLRAFQLARNGFNLFITGSAGVGKSYLLRMIIEELLKEKTVAVTASTGTAAHIIGGITLHSWLALGLAKEPVDILLRRIKRFSSCSENIRKTQVLIIDEISQVRGEFLDKIDACCKHVRKNNFPFGGIQVIICGDFAQLPPVMTLDLERELDQSYKPEPISNKTPPIDYAFKSDVWKTMNLKTAYLREVVRQKGDPTFVRILNNLREGKVSDEDFQPLLKCIGRKFSNPDSQDNSHNIFPRRDSFRPMPRRQELISRSTRLWMVRRTFTTPDSTSSVRNVKTETGRSRTRSSNGCCTIPKLTELSIRVYL